MDGKWSPWPKYSACSVTCGGGVQHRTRLCDNPPPSNGRKDCVGRNLQTRRCAEWDCPGKVHILSQRPDTVQSGTAHVD